MACCCFLLELALTGESFARALSDKKLSRSSAWEEIYFILENIGLRIIILVLGSNTDVFFIFVINDGSRYLL